MISSRLAVLAALACVGVGAAVFAASVMGGSAAETAALAAAAAALVVALAARSGAKAPPAPVETPAPESPAVQGDLELLESLPAAVILVDAEMRIRRINAHAKTLIGPAELGAPLVSAIRAPDFIDMVEDVVASGAASRLDFTLRRSREERALHAHVRPLAPSRRGAAPRRPAALILIEDHTRMRRIEEMRQGFIANASHELKTPLASIMGFIETLQGAAKDDPAARARFLGIMAAQAERMKRLVEDLMSLNRIEMNVHVRPTGRVDLGALAHETAAALEPLAAERAAKVRVEAPEAGPVVTGDRDQLAQLLTNLIDNAIKYGGAGVSITLSTAPPAPEWPNMIGLTVADDGPGIPREHIPRLTERFYRVSAARSKAVGGTGLGLAIAKHILQRHRGELAVRSRPGEGATFTIWLPDDAKT